jgi:hypothetical protein
MWYQWKVGHEVTFLEFWFHASAKFVALNFGASFVLYTELFWKLSGCETNKIEDWVFMVGGISLGH